MNICPICDGKLDEKYFGHGCGSDDCLYHHIHNNYMLQKDLPFLPFCKSALLCSNLHLHKLLPIPNLSLPSHDLVMLNLLKWFQENLSDSFIDGIKITGELMINYQTCNSWELVIRTESKQDLLIIYLLGSGTFIVNNDHGSRFLNHDIDYLTEVICDELTTLTANSEGVLKAFHG